MQSDDLFQNEKKLVQELAKGNEMAFRKLYEIHWNRIYSMALLYVKSPAAAQDVVQEVFFKIWVKRQDFNNIENFTAFLHTLARNFIISSLRKKIPDYGLEQMAENKLPQSNSIPEQVLIDKETEEIICQAIGKLSPRQQEIYILSRKKGLSLKDISRQLQLSHDTVREHMSKALKNIRAYLKKFEE